MTRSWTIDWGEQRILGRETGLGRAEIWELLGSRGGEGVVLGGETGLGRAEISELLGSRGGEGVVCANRGDMLGVGQWWI